MLPGYFEQNQNLKASGLAWTAFGKMRLAAILVQFGFVCLLTGGVAQAQEANAPARTLDAVASLEAQNDLTAWVELRPGMLVSRTGTGSGANLTAYRIQLSQFFPSVALHAGDTGDRVGEMGKRNGAVFAINGGFFSQKSTGEINAIGAVRSSGESDGTAWKTRGGYLVMERDGIAIQPSSDGLPKTDGDYLQSMPLVIEPGQKWAMNTNSGIAKRRMLVCKTPVIDGEKREEELLVLMVTGSGLSLFEAGWILRPRAEGGFFGCDAALALDGGGSVQSWVRDEPQFSFRGGTPVPNAIIFKQR